MSRTHSDVCSVGRPLGSDDTGARVNALHVHVLIGEAIDTFSHFFSFGVEL